MIEHGKMREKEIEIKEYVRKFDIGMNISSRCRREIIMLNYYKLPSFTFISCILSFYYNDPHDGLLVLVRIVLSVLTKSTVSARRRAQTSNFIVNS